MAHNDYRPDYEYLWSLGFVETDNGEEHPYNRWNELRLDDKAVLCIDAFWDFSLDIADNDDGSVQVPILFYNDDELEGFINHFKK